MNITETVRDIMCEQLNLPPEAVGMDKKIYGDLGADSLDALFIVMSLEEELDIEISDLEAQYFKTPQDIVTYLKGIMKDKD